MESFLRKLLFSFFLIITINGCEKNPTVFVNEQTLIGKIQDNSKIAKFLGVPFAEAPINSLRWQKPFPFNPRN